MISLNKVPYQCRHQRDPPGYLDGNLTMEKEALTLKKRSPLRWPRRIRIRIPSQMIVVPCGRTGCGSQAYIG